MSQDLRLVSASALSSAAGLARVHGHYWWGLYDAHRDAVDAAVALGITVAGLSSMLSSLGSPDDDGGISFGLDHVTGSGRTSWVIAPDTGVVTLEVHRPSAAWCRWQALEQRLRVTNDNSREDRDSLRSIVGPEPLRGDRVVLRVIVDADHPSRSLAHVLDRSALAARHVDDIVRTLSLWGAGWAAQLLAAELPEWVSQPERGLVVDTAGDATQTLLLLHWGQYIAHFDGQLHLDAGQRLTDAAKEALLERADLQHRGSEVRVALGETFDRLVYSTPVELVVLLRRAQAERDALLAETLKLESRLTIAEVAIHTAQQEDRAPIWPPACAADRNRGVMRDEMDEDRFPDPADS